MGWLVLLIAALLIIYYYAYTQESFFGSNFPLGSYDPNLYPSEITRRV